MEPARLRRRRGVSDRRMRLSTRTRYGLRAAVELALRGAWKGSEKRPVPLAAIAKRQGIPEQYLRQIFMHLNHASIVESTMGKHGGYRLAREPERTSALDVAKALGEEIEPVFCVRTPSRCRRVRECPTHPLWARLADAVKETLAATTVAELAERCPARGKQPMPRGYAFQI